MESYKYFVSPEYVGCDIFILLAFLPKDNFKTQIVKANIVVICGINYGS